VKGYSIVAPEIDDPPDDVINADLDVPSAEVEIAYEDLQLLPVTHVPSRIHVPWNDMEL
jgi:hypothetical protein